MEIISFIYNLLWGDILTIPLPNGSSVGISLMIILLIPTGIYFTIRTKFLPFRLFKEMIRISLEKEEKDDEALSGMQALIVSTATRVGMGNMVGVVAAIGAGGPGAIFWMWVTALIGTSTAFIEGTLAQIYKVKDPLYGGYKGGPSYYMHEFFSKGKKVSLIAILFALSALLCFCGVSSVIGNSISSSFYNAFEIPPIVSTIFVVVLSAIIVLRKNATVKVLDIMVPVMAFLYLFVAIFIMIKNVHLLPSVFVRIFEEAFGLRQMVAGGFGAALMNGVQRGLFSNEAGSGSAPCAAATSDVSHPAKAGLFQAFGVIIDTIVICTCSAMIMLLAPSDLISGLEGMELLQTAMNYHFGNTGVIFIVITLWLFSFSTFIGIIFYARSNVSYLFGDKMKAQTIFKFVALAMLFVGGMSSYSFVWDLGNIGIGLMTVFNIITILPMGKIALDSLKDYEKKYIKK